MTSIKIWLSGLYNRFDKDIELLESEEPFWKVCHSCPDAYCCINEKKIPVMTEEWNLITAYVKESFTRRNKDILFGNIESGRKQCPFIFENRCSVYPVRPWACRIYPYTISFHQGPGIFNVGNICIPACPSLAAHFGVDIGKPSFLKATIMDRHKSKHLIRCKLGKPHPLWFIDTSDYVREYDKTMPRNEEDILDGDDMHNWIGIPKWLRDKKKITQDKFLECFGLD